MPPLDATMWAYGVLAVALAAAAIDDVCTGKIHNWITYPAILIGLVVPAIAMLLEFFYGRSAGLRLGLGDALKEHGLPHERTDMADLKEQPLQRRGPLHRIGRQEPTAATEEGIPFLRFLRNLRKEPKSPYPP